MNEVDIDCLGPGRAPKLHTHIFRKQSSERNRQNSAELYAILSYVSGPIEGMLLHLEDASWRKGLTAQDDLEELLWQGFGIRDALRAAALVLTECSMPIALPNRTSFHLPAKRV
jgi:hypothetical protein